MPRVSVLIPHHRSVKLLEPLFASLFAMDMDPRRVEYVLVDNGATDGSVEFVRRRFPAVKIFALGRNEGFAPALNRAARVYESRWLCFLNNDVRVEVDWLSNLLHAARQIDAPCFASHLMDWKGKRTQFGGGWINLFGKGFESTGIQEEQPYEIFFACGCGMMIRRDVFLDAGGFDDDYFMIYEDVDLGWRLRLLGHKIYLAPDAKIMHKGHASLDQIPYRQKALYFERNSLATIYKNLSDESLSAVLPLALREAALRAKGAAGQGLPFRYSGDGLAILEAVQAFWDRLPVWQKKRASIQAKRTVSDAELFQRFFPNPDQLWAFNAEQYKRLHHPRLLPHIKGALEEAARAVGTAR
ncbi:MAG: glycosyltransferase family 2 protein [Candidatus Omnitrophica bacterium]|nr:glycosyltransferase family 2 protein [Candidatus Omnitrophota bacterium]